MIKKFKCIHVGLGNFSLQRLQLNLNNNLFDVVAFVDIDVTNAADKLKKLNNLPENYENRVFKSISDAQKKFSAEVCFIYVASEIHPKLIIESLENKLHTFCVKSIACEMTDFKKIIEVKKKYKKLKLVQGLNNQWNEASLKMQELLKDKENFGELMIGNCTVWGRQNLKSEKPTVDVIKEGIFFHSMGIHQLSQIVAALGLPESVVSSSLEFKQEDIGFKGVTGTSSGVSFFKYKNGGTISYSATRGGHGNPFGFASRWSGNWLFHGTKGDIKRDGGRLTLYKNGNIVEDFFLKDLDNNLYLDELKQYEMFHQNLSGNNKFDMQKKSLESWLLMEACNISIKKDKKILLNDLILETGFKNL